MTKLRLGLSHHQEHKLKRNFQDTINPIFNGGEDVETSCQYLFLFTLNE